MTFFGGFGKEMCLTFFIPVSTGFQEVVLSWENGPVILPLAYTSCQGSKGLRCEKFMLSRPLFKASEQLCCKSITEMHEKICTHVLFVEKVDLFFKEKSI